mgnify:CR=1 FL=1
MDAIRWEGNTLYLLDQTKLPVTEEWISYTDYRPVADAIRTMVVRGAPAIGIFAGYCLYVLARQLMEQGEDMGGLSRAPAPIKQAVLRLFPPHEADGVFHQGHPFPFI